MITRRSKGMAVQLDASAQVITQMAPLRPAGRVMRNPRHNFRLRTMPWVIQPFMIAPVLAGETMKNALLQARAVTDPIKDKLGGWWNEYYLFYVKHRDLAQRDALVAMHVEGASLSALNSAAAVGTYHFGTAPNFTQMCLESVTEWYFRDDGEAWNVAGSTISQGGVTMPLAKASERLWWDSLKLEAQVPSIVSDTPGHIADLPSHMAAFQSAYDQWTYMRENALTAATFEDYLKTFGIKADRAVSETEFKPELVRYIRDWTYPSNTVVPETGAVTSACSWAVAERADKDRFFKEPGFLFGVTVSRPKIYFRNQDGSATHALTTPFTWLPALLRDDPYTSVIEHQHTEGPITNVNAADDYWWDTRDLFLYGDQFVNFDLAATDSGICALPSSSGAGNLNLNYVSSTDINDLFQGAGTANFVRIDGVVSLNIASHTKDHT